MIPFLPYITSFVPPSWTRRIGFAVLSIFLKIKSPYAIRLAGFGGQENCTVPTSMYVNRKGTAVGKIFQQETVLFTSNMTKRDL